MEKAADTIDQICPAHSTCEATLHDLPLLHCRLNGVADQLRNRPAWVNETDQCTEAGAKPAAADGAIAVATAAAHEMERLP
jgi:hypothetical protein